MNEFSNRDTLTMKMLHYFIVEKHYKPVIIRGLENEIWLENLDNEYKIVRIVTNYIHNNTQLEYDLAKTNSLIKQIKKKTLNFKIKTLSFFLNLGDNVDLASNDFFENIAVHDEKDLKKLSKVNKFFEDIKDKLINSEKGVNLFEKINKDIANKNKEEIKKSEAFFKPNMPMLTYILIGLNVLIFILTLYFQLFSKDFSLINFGALNRDLVLKGDWYRILTSMFLHANLIHLFFNNYALYVIGPQVESFYGKNKFLVIYLLSAVVGNFVSLLFVGGYSVGASGAIFGLLGSLLYFVYNNRLYYGKIMQSQIIQVILINLLLGFAIAGINNAAHIGGLIGGVLAAIIVGVKDKTSNFERINGAIVTTLLLGFIIYLLGKL